MVQVLMVFPSSSPRGAASGALKDPRELHSLSELAARLAFFLLVTSSAVKILRGHRNVSHLTPTALDTALPIAASGGTIDVFQRRTVWMVRLGI